MIIDLVHPGYFPVKPSDLEESGLGGNETALVLAARGLASRGHDVRVFADSPASEDQGARWLPLSSLREDQRRDVIIFWVRTKRFEPGRFNASARVAKLGLKTPNDSLLGQVLDGSINTLIAFSEFQRRLYIDNFGYPEAANWVVTADGLDISHYAQPLPKVAGRFLHAANPKRGLAPLLDMWPVIRSVYPEAELFVASSHLLRGITAEEDERRAGDLYRRAAAMAGDGVRFLGRVAKPDLITLQLSSEFYLYPTMYPETCCIAALEAAAAGAVIVCSPAGALPDRVIDGVTGFLIDGDPAEPETAHRFADRIAGLRKDRPRLEAMARAARDLAATHDYAHVLPIWETAFARAMRFARTSSGSDGGHA